VFARTDARNGSGELLLAVSRHIGAVPLGEEREHFAVLGMSTRIMFRVQHVTIDHDVEHPFGSGHDGQILDDVLVVAQQIVNRAHGAG
jgi:hypothetical protein